METMVLLEDCFKVFVGTVGDSFFLAVPVAVSFIFDNKPAIYFSASSPD